VIEDNAWAVRHEAWGRLKYARLIAGSCRPCDLVGGKTRRPIIRAFLDEALTKQVLGISWTSQRALWARIVDIVADRPTALGFYQFDEGIRGLACDLDVDYSTLSRNLASWRDREPPLVVMGFGEKTWTRDKYALLQVPMLTQWLLWVAETRARVRKQRRDLIDDQAIIKIAQLLIPLWLPPPPTNEVTWQEGRRLLQEGSVTEQTLRDWTVRAHTRS